MSFINTICFGFLDFTGGMWRWLLRRTLCRWFGHRWEEVNRYANVTLCWCKRCWRCEDREDKP